MAEFADSESDKMKQRTIMDVISPDELNSLMNLKMLLAQYESGELIDDEDDESDPSGSLRSLPSSAPGTPPTRYRFSDMAVIRFFRGRKRDEARTIRAMIRHLKWRHEMQIPSITLDSIRSEVNKRKIITFGTDREKRPTIYIFASRHNTTDRDLLVMQKFIIFTLESAMKATVPTEEKLVIVFDLTGFSMACMDYDVVKMLVNILQYNYPEVLHVALIVNAPLIFSACWLIIRPWLDPVTAAKAMFVDKAKLGMYIDSSDLPPDFSDPSNFDDNEDDNDEEGDSDLDGNGELAKDSKLGGENIAAQAANASQSYPTV